MHKGEADDDDGMRTIRYGPSPVQEEDEDDAEASPPVAYPLVSNDIFELAAAKSCLELIAAIGEGTADGGVEVLKKLLKEFYALCLQAERNPDTLDAVHQALLGGRHSTWGVELLLGVLSCCHHEKAVDLLLDLFNRSDSLNVPGVLFQRRSLLLALVGGGMRQLGTIDEQIRALDKEPPDERMCRMPSDNPPSNYVIRADVVEALTRLFETRVINWPSEDRRTLCAVLGSVLENYADCATSAKSITAYGNLLESELAERIRRQFVVYLEQGDPADREWILCIASSTGAMNTSLRDVRLRLMSEDDNWRVRNRCALDLRQLNHDPAVQARLLKTATEDESVFVRVTALASLPKGEPFDSQRLVMATAEFEKAERMDARWRLVPVIGMCGEAAIPFLERLSYDRDETVRDEASRLIARIRQKADANKKAK